MPPPLVLRDDPWCAYRLGSQRTFALARSGVLWIVESQEVDRQHILLKGR